MSVCHAFRLLWSRGKYARRKSGCGFNPLDRCSLLLFGVLTSTMPVFSAIFSRLSAPAMCYALQEHIEVLTVLHVQFPITCLEWIRSGGGTADQMTTGVDRRAFNLAGLHDRVIFLLEFIFWPFCGFFLHCWRICE